MQIVTLTTDFGNSDYYVASLKASIISKCDTTHIVDISHAIPSFDIVQGAFYIANTYYKFPKNTIHIAAIQNFGSTSNKILVIKKHDHFFVGPNNGIFSLVFDDLDENEIYELNSDGENLDFLNEKLAHASACLLHKLDFDSFCNPNQNFHKKIGLQAVTTSNTIRATIMHVDHFGNVIVNLSKEKFAQIRKGRPFKLYYKSKDPLSHLCKNYNDVALGDALCLFNSSGFLEIAVYMGNASELLGLKQNETIQIDFV